MAEAPPGVRARPRSPHLQVWRWHVTMLTSILHRATGVALYGGALILAGWAIALAAGPGPYGAYASLLGSIPGQVVLFVLTVSVFYHLANGVRHLVWDTGHGFELKSADASGVAALVFGAAAAVGLWAVWLTGKV